VSNPIDHLLSRRRFLVALAGGAGAALIGGCGESDAQDVPATNVPGTTATEQSRATVTPFAVTLEEKIGQMLMIGFRGFSVTPGVEVFADIAERRVGSTVLFDFDVPSSSSRRNIESPPQVLKLTRDLQALSARRLLIAADQEGGIVARLKPSNGFRATLSAQEIGDLNDLQATRRYAGEMAATLAQYGINLNLAPVVDVNLNPDNPIIGGIERSFSANPDRVAEQAIAFIDAHHEHGVLTTLKHFPGHGSSEADSHLGFVDVTDAWSDRELIPYREIINAKRADAIMTAHIFNARLDPEFPATLSKRTITGILRDRFGYNGVIITDDMMMGAIANFYDFEDAVVASVDAGADIVAVANNATTYEPDISARTYNALVQAVARGRLSEQRIDESYRRIVELKARLG
jgi:beta-N-acetylhexosaminidase